MKQKRKTTKIHFFQSVHFKLPAIFIVLLLLVLEFIGAFFTREVESDVLSNFDRQVNDQLSFLVDSVEPVLEGKPADDQAADERTAQLNRILRRFSVNNIIEVQVLDASNVLLGTNNPANQGRVGQYVGDPMVDQAIYANTEIDQEIYDQTQGQRLKKYAVPFFSEGNVGVVNGVVLLTVNLESVYRQINSIVGIYFSASAVALVIALLITIALSRVITRPLQEETDEIEQIAKGNYNGRVSIYAEDEIGKLGRSINYLSRRVKEAQDATESERQRLDSVLKHMSDGVVATNRRNRVVIINQSALSLIGKTEEEVIGQPILDVLNLRDRYTDSDLRDSGGEVQMEFTDESGNPSIVRGVYTLIQRDTSFTSGVVWVLSDITERQKIEAERRQFVSNVSHELRTPLTSVNSYTETLLDGAADDPELSKRFLGVIQTETHRMIRMINDLLSLSRIDDKREQLHVEVLDFNELVHHILDRFQMIVKSEEYSDRSYRIIRELSQTPLWVEVDRDHMTRVIDNLMNNAIKYSPDGGDITVRLMTRHNELILSIQDQGLGIPHKDIPHVFDRFFRIDKARSRAQGGTGLGLSIAKEVVELHGGKIWVNSIGNKGSTFYISLPYDENLVDEEAWDA